MHLLKYNLLPQVVPYTPHFSVVLQYFMLAPRAPRKSNDNYSRNLDPYEPVSPNNLDSLMVQQLLLSSLLIFY